MREGCKWSLPVKLVRLQETEVLNPYRMSMRICAGAVVWLITSLVVAQPHARGLQDRSKTFATPSDLALRISRWANLLDQQTIDARILADDLRPEALTSIADAYWEVSPEKSTELFIAALDAAFSIEKENTRQIALNRILSSAAKREPQLAKTLTRLLLNKDNGAKHAITTAVELLKLDTKIAESLALSSVSIGPSFDSAWLIFQLQARDSSAADRVYSAYLNNPNSRTLPRLLWLAGYPFGYGEAFGGAMDPVQLTGISGFRFNTLQANPALAVAFLNVADQTIAATVNSLNGATPEQVEAINGLVFFTVTYLLPEIEKYRPDLYARWAALEVQFSQVLNAAHRSAIHSKLRTILADRERTRSQSTDIGESVEDTLEKAEHLAGSCQRDGIYANVSFELSHKTDFKRALSIAEKISALDLRANVIQFIYYDMAMAGASAKASITIDEALKYANRVEPPDQRALLFLTLSSSLSKDGKREESKQLILDATNLSERIAEPSARAAVLVAIEKQLTESDFEDRFKVLKNALAILNRNKETKIDQLSVWRRVDLGCEQKGITWHGGRIANLNLMDGIVRFSQTREDEALQLAMEFDSGVNRIRAVAAVAGSAMKRIKAEEDSKKNTPTKQNRSGL
jgi:hypothetical protein